MTKHQSVLPGPCPGPPKAPRLAIRVVDQLGATLTEAQVRLIELTPVDVHEAKHGAKLVPPDALTDETLAVGSSPRRGSTITKRSIRAVTGHPLEMGQGDWRSQRVKLATDCCCVVTACACSI